LDVNFFTLLFEPDVHLKILFLLGVFQNNSLVSLDLVHDLLEVLYFFNSSLEATVQPLNELIRVRLLPGRNQTHLLLPCC